MPVIMKDNVQYAYTTKGTVFHTLSNAEYEALPESEKMNGDVYCIPDREPILNPDEVWAKIGTGTLDIGDDLTDGVNQLNSSLNDLVKVVTLSATYTLAANESKNFSYTAGSIPTGYTNCGMYASATGNAKVIMRFANSNEVGIINLNNSSASGTFGVRVLCVKSSLVG